MNEENDGVKSDLQAVEALFKANGAMLSEYGGRAVALLRFVEAVTPVLNAQQRLEVERRFRLEIEKVLSLTDDVLMPSEYHTALLNQTNSLLKLLSTREQG